MMKANELEISQSTIRIWIAGYEKYGIEYFESRPRNQSYTKEFKEMVIHEYLEGHESYLDLAMKYHIPSSTTVET